MKSSLLILFVLVSQVFACNEASALRNWNDKKQIELRSMDAVPSRTAVLIIVPPTLGNCYTNCRWNLGKKVWEQYMNTNPNVDCFFLQATEPSFSSSEEIWCEGNTIYIGDPWYQKYHSDRLLHKTIAAIEMLLPHYTHFVRTNINSFFDLNAVCEYADTHPQSFFTGPLWENSWYVVGYGIIFTADVASHMVSEYRRLEGEEIVSHNHADDCVLTSLATGIFPFASSSPFTCCPSLQNGQRQIMCNNSFITKRVSDYGLLLSAPITLRSALKYSARAKNSIMLYRTPKNLHLNELAKLYEHLLETCYPELPAVDLIEYSNTLPTTQIASIK
jgi:hypothetical protein